MNNTLATGLLLTLFLFFIGLIPEAVLYGMQLTKAHNFVTHAVEIGEKNGGFVYSHNGKLVDHGTYLKNKMKENKMEDWSIDYTKGKVNYNEKISVSVSSEHQFLIFRLIGVDSMKAPIKAHREGVSQVYFR